VVLPVSLLAQWEEEEVKSKAPHLSVFTYHGDGVQHFHSNNRGKLAHELSKFDVVLTTMSKLKELTANRTNVGGQLKNCLAKGSVSNA
jgi:SNF2 family DNA or RNA helicase